MLPVAILAGGMATRLHPVTHTLPKALIEIDGEPFLGRQLSLLRSKGIERVILCVGHLGDQIRAYAGDGRQFGLQLEYSHDGPRLRGTAGALRAAAPLLGDAFFVLYGDSYLTCDYGAVQDHFLRSGRQGLMTVFRNDQRWDSSNVEFEAPEILAYDKETRSPAMRHIDYGLSAFRRSVLDLIPEDGPFDLAALYRELLRRRELAAYEVADRFYEIGSVEGIRELEAFLSRSSK